MKADHREQIDFIFECLKKGWQRKDILQEFAKTYKVSEKTFDNRLKIANEEYIAFKKSVSERVNTKVDEEIEERKLTSLSVAERIDILAKIAKGEILVKKTISTKDGLADIECEPDHTDRKSAIAELNKMDGSYAAQKTEISSSEPIIINWSGNSANAKAD